MSDDWRHDMYLKYIDFDDCENPDVEELLDNIREFLSVRDENGDDKPYADRISGKQCLELEYIFKAIAHAKWDSGYRRRNSPVEILVNNLAENSPLPYIQMPIHKDVCKKRWGKKEGNLMYVSCLNTHARLLAGAATDAAEKLGHEINNNINSLRENKKNAK